MFFQDGETVVFSNLFFLYVFFPLNIILYFLTESNKARNVIMLAFSLFFYAWGEPVWVGLLVLTAMLNWALAQVIDRKKAEGKPGQAKAALTAAIAVDLGLLGIFKYTGFFISNLNFLFGTTLGDPGIVLPIGISFYTFQIISYMVDVMRGTVPSQKAFYKFLMYVTMYHQLVAGPIVRYEWIAEEIDHRPVNIPEAWGGLCRFCIGLTKKVVVANAAGSLASRYLDKDFSGVSSAGALFGLLMFALQIYYDFSAYSDMAIGMGRLFGFHYMENFEYPYISRSVTEFWRRWHISLSSFFRDYLYIPLGGKYRHQTRNILIVWLLTGLWHGASWNFVLWGGYYGLLLIVEKRFLLKWLQKAPGWVGWLWSTLAVMGGWSLFYFTDMTRLGAFFAALFAGSWYDPGLWAVIQNNALWLAAALAFCAPVVPWFAKAVNRQLGDGDRWRMVPAQLALNCLLLLVCTALLVGQSYNPFLYYRF